MSTPYGGDQDQTGAGPGGYPPPPAGGDPSGFGQPHQAPGPVGAGQLAGFWIRFGGAIIDAIILGIVAFILGSILGMDTVAARQGLSSLLGALYFTYMHGAMAQSLGQKIVGIRLVDQSGSGDIDYVRAFIRWLVSLLSGFALLIGYLWMLWDPQNQTWHDKVARTLVVKA